MCVCLTIALYVHETVCGAALPSRLVFKLAFLTGFYLLVKGPSQDDCILTCLITAIVMLVLGLKATAEVFNLCLPLLLLPAPLTSS